MAAYRTILTSFWSDPEVKRLIKAGKRDAVQLALYLITNDHGHVSGFYHLPLYIIAGETGLKDPEALFEWLEHPRWGGGAWGFAYYDRETEHVWVRSMLRHQGRGEKNAAAAAKQLKAGHGSFLIAKFLEYYPSVGEMVGNLDIQAEPVEEKPEEAAPAEPKAPALTEQAREVWAIYLEELRECKKLLGLRNGDEPELTPARLEKIVGYVKSHGLGRVSDAPRGLRFSDWHMGRMADGKHKLGPEVVFHHTSKIHQIENLADLYREHKANPAKMPAPKSAAAAGVRAPVVIPMAPLRAQVIRELEKRKSYELVTEDEFERFTERIDGARDIESLQGVARDLGRKPA